MRNDSLKVVIVFLFFLLLFFFFIPLTFFPPASSSGEMHPAGFHVYSFSVNLPQTLPSSYEDPRAQIAYSCTAKIDKPWKLNDTVKIPFTIIHGLDLNQESNALSLKVSSASSMEGDVQPL